MRRASGYGNFGVKEKKPPHDGGLKEGPVVALIALGLANVTVKSVVRQIACGRPICCESDCDLLDPLSWRLLQYLFKPAFS